MLVLETSVADDQNDLFVVVNGQVIAEIAVMEVRKDRVRLGIVAPQSVRVLRRQVLERNREKARNGK